MVTLLELPDELVCQVLSKIAADKDSKGRLSPLANGHRDIVGFALTCHRAWAFSEQFLYSAVLLRRSKEVITLGQFYWTDESTPLASNHARGRHMRDLAVVPAQHDDQQWDFMKLSEIIGSMPHGQLARLHIELPYRQTYDANFWDKFKGVFGKSVHGNIGRFFRLPWASRLEHCHLNFQKDHGEASSLSGLVSIFTAPRLRSLVIVGVEFSFTDFNWRSHYANGLVKRGSPIERLSLHQCRILPKDFEVLLSMPRSLKYLSYFTDGWVRGVLDDVDVTTTLWRSFCGMCEHLAQQKDSLAQLDLDLGGLTHVELHETPSFKFYLGHLTSLTDLTIKNRFQDDAGNGRMLLDRLPPSLRRLSICDFPYTSDGDPMITAAQYYLTEDSSTGIGLQEPAIQSALGARRKQRSKLLPNLQEYSVSLSARDSTGILPELLHESFEDIGERYRGELGWRFSVNRITQMRGAVPPYLWDEHVVDFVKVYDNTIEEYLWDSKSEFEIVEDEERERATKRARQERAAHEERERLEAETARSLGLTDSVTPPSPPPSISPVNGSLSQSVATASQANMAVVAAAMAMANANMNAVLGGLDG